MSVESAESAESVERVESEKTVKIASESESVETVHPRPQIFSSSLVSLTLTHSHYVSVSACLHMSVSVYKFVG